MASANGGQSQFNSIELRARDLIAQCARVTEMLSRITGELRREPAGDAHTERWRTVLRGQNEWSESWV